MKKGFTVTEILITMGIVGIVAALAIPNMVSKINRSTVGISLARAVELTEEGFANMLSAARENVATLNASAGSDIDPASISTISSLTINMFDLNNLQNGDNSLIGDFGSLIPLIGSYIGADDITDNDEIIDYTTELALANNAVNLFYNPNHPIADPRFFKFKKINAYLIFDRQDRFNDDRITGDPNLVIRRIYIDANGAAAPNEPGKDIFLFGLTDSGHLVPAGSVAYGARRDSNNNIVFNNIFREDIQMMCGGSSIPTQNLFINDLMGALLSCTTRVVEDGWRVNYSY